MKIIISKSLTAQLNDNSPLNYQDKRFSPPDDKPNFRDIVLDLSTSNKNGELFSYKPFEDYVKQVLVSQGQGIINAENINQFYDENIIGQIKVSYNEYGNEKIAKDIDLIALNSNKKIKLSPEQHNILLSIINEFLEN